MAVAPSKKALSIVHSSQFTVTFLISVVRFVIWRTGTSSKNEVSRSDNIYPTLDPRFGTGPEDLLSGSRQTQKGLVTFGQTHFPISYSYFVSHFSYIDTKVHTKSLSVAATPAVKVIALLTTRPLMVGVRPKPMP